MLNYKVQFKGFGASQGPFVFLEIIDMLHNNLKFVNNLDADYTSKIDFRSADPEDRATLRRMANRQIRRKVRQELKCHLDSFLD